MSDDDKPDGRGPRRPGGRSGPAAGKTGAPGRDRKRGAPAAGGKPFRKASEGGRPQRKGPPGASRGPRPDGGDGSPRPAWKRRDETTGGEQEGRRPPRAGKAERAAQREGEPPRKFGARSGAPREGFKRPRNEDGGDKPRRTEGGRDGFRPPRRDGPAEGPRRFGGAGGRERRPDDRGEGRPRARAAGSRSDRSGSATPAPEAAEGERIAKRLARIGIASRRDAEELIAAGRIRVNGKVLTSPAVNVSTDDVIELDGAALPPVERTRLFLFHKPAGVVTTNRDPEGRRTVFDVLPEDLPRVVTVGRLDINTEGLLLLTNDGGLARTLELPATGWLRRYRARVHGRVDGSKLAELKDGIAVDGVFYGSVEATLDREQGSNAWLTIGLREGKNREVKNILGALGLEVGRLIRISFGPFQLGELPEGHVQEIKGRTLREQLGERLVEESGANFDADIVKPFSNKPVRRDARGAGPDEGGAPPARTPRPLQVGEGGLVKNRRRDADRHREDVLGRLQTKAPRGRDDGDRKPGRPRPEGGKPQRRDREERERKPIEAPGGRKSNVWMAPGARPAGASPAKPKLSSSGAAGAGGLTRKPRPQGKDGPDRDGPGPRKGGRNADRRR